MREHKYLGNGWSGKVHESQGLKFVHCNVQRYSKSVFNEIVQAMADIVWQHHLVFGIAMDAKQEKFMRAIGGKPSTLLHEDSSGTLRRLYVWE